MSKLPSSSLPQADQLGDVALVAEAVGNGAVTYQDIARYIGKVGRQGRYYRLAAELIGLISNVSHQNEAHLTETGQEYLALPATERRSMLRSLVTNSRLFQRVIPFLELYPEGATKGQMETFLAQVVEPVGPTMIGRRASTVLSWLSYLGVVSEDEGRYRVLGSSFSAPQLTTNLEEPLLPRSSLLSEYQIVAERARAAASTLTISIDEVRTERAANAHIRLVNLVAGRLARSGCVPHSSSLIDLATRVGDRSAIFEMKSITEDNARGQVRRGISQLYEYRFLQNLPGAELVLVLERQLPPTLQWMNEYMENDRGIRIVWDGSEELYASDPTRAALAFLWS